MANIIEKKTYVMSTVGEENHNKVWLYELYDDGTVNCMWGRVGKGMQSKTFSGGKYFAEGKAREKLAKGYREIAVVGNGTSPGTSKVVNSNNLKDIATKQIQHSCPTVKKLIEYLTKVNAHQIYAGTKGAITYNDTTGLFQTPVGIVSKENINEARRILVILGDCVSRNAFDSSKMRSSVEDYLMLVPQEVGRKLTTLSFLPDLMAVQKQNDILDGLETSYVSAISTPTKTDTSATTINEPKIFNVKLDRLNDDKEFDRIKKKIEQTRQGVHSCSLLKIDKMYSVEIADEKEAFEKDGRKLSNVWELYHGSPAKNLLSVLKGGLKLPSQVGNAQITGSNFGYPGLYFSDQSTKSLNYSYGYWSGNRDNNCFMFVADVGMGNYYIPTGPRSSKPPTGYDSYYAQAHRSGVINNEMIVFRTSQVHLKYLVEFNK